RLTCAYPFHNPMSFTMPSNARESPRRWLFIQACPTAPLTRHNAWTSWNGTSSGSNATYDRAFDAPDRSPARHADRFGLDGAHHNWVLPSPEGRGWTAAGAFTSRRGPGEG